MKKFSKSFFCFVFKNFLCLSSQTFEWWVFFSSPLLTLEFSMNFCQVSLWFDNFSLTFTFWTIRKSSKNLRKLEKVIRKKKPIKLLSKYKANFLSIGIIHKIFLFGWANRQNKFVLAIQAERQQRIVWGKLIGFWCSGAKRMILIEIVFLSPFMTI